MTFRFTILASAACGLILFFGNFANLSAQQITTIAPRQTPTPPPQIPAPPAQLPTLTREQRQQAYAKLLEGQRYIWAMQNQRTQTGTGASGRLVRAALQKAVEINPGLAEAYTALAGLLFFTQGSNVAEIERLAGFATRLDPNNFGAHQLLARIYTRQSGIFTEKFDREKAEKAITEWREIARLDPRNAEAWAFLSELYDQTGQSVKQIEALEKWSGAAAPLDDRFYRFVTGKPTLLPEAATAQLGRAYLKAGRISEAVAILSRALAENADDENALSALQDAIETANPADAAKAIQVLETAVIANPSNESLLELLIDTQIRAGRIEEAARLLRDSSRRFAASDKVTAANLSAKLGAVYAEAGRDTEAIAAYEEALRILNIGNQPLVTEIERDFAAQNIPKLVALYRNSGQTAKARETIARLGTLLGSSDISADIQLIEMLRAAGDYETALQTVRDARKRFPEDQSLLQLEASVLTDMGKVDEGVALLRAKIVNKTKQISVPSTQLADFLTNLTISRLYLQAGRSEEAIAAARQALDLSTSQQMTNIATVTLATAQNAAGDFKAAETSLREVLKQEPNNATALNNLGYFLVERGERLSEAVDLIKRALEREPNNASFLDSLGWAHFKMGQLAEAEKNLTEAARRNPNSAAIQNHLGDLYERQGRPEQARAAWRKALNLAKEPNEIEKIKAKLGEPKKSKK